ncbi:MAG TPA: phosphoribosylanthranilate isomerase [Terriglobales bacterium]|nr:phosphoribosylanthranilate isomerase [Terriglobales bacterium]
MHTWIKICGTTSLADALASVEAGADALGFIFAPSRRQIKISATQQIIRELPPHVERIGVFLDAAPEEIRAVLDRVPLTGIQMHGSESPAEIYRQLPAERRDGLFKIKTIIARDGFEMPDGQAVDAFLLDSGAGSGKVFDWESVKAKLKNRSQRIILAGGLTSENVGQALRTVHPWGVDVVTGVESEPGRKEHEKLKAFVSAVRKAENEEAWEARQN